MKRLDQRARDAILPLDRLIGIGVGPERDGRGGVFGGGEFALEQRRGALLGEQPAFEIEPGRKAHIGVSGPCEAVEAAVLAASVGIDRAVEGDVGRIVARDDALRLLERHLGGEGLGRLLAGPAVVEILAAQNLEAAGNVGPSAPSAPPLGGREAFGDRGGAMTGIVG